MVRTMWLAWVLSACVLPVEALQLGGGVAQWSVDGVDALTVQLGNGALEVESVPGDVVHAEWEGGGIGASPRAHLDESGTLHFEGGILGGGSLRLEVPHGADLELRLQHGEIDAALDAPANVVACVGAGSISLGLPPGPYDLDVDAVVGVVEQGIFDDVDAPYTVHVCMGVGDAEIYAR